MEDTLIFAFNVVYGGPNIHKNPLLSLGGATVLFRRGVGATFINSFRCDCWDGSTHEFDPATEETLGCIDKYRSNDSEHKAYSNFRTLFEGAYDTAKSLGVDFVVVTEFVMEIVWLSHLSSKYEGGRPIPMYLGDELIHVVELCTEIHGHVPVGDRVPEWAHSSLAALGAFQYARML